MTHRGAALVCGTVNPGEPVGGCRKGPTIMLAPVRDVAGDEGGLPGAARPEAESPVLRDDILSRLGRADLEICIGGAWPARPRTSGRLAVPLVRDSRHLPGLARAAEQG
jgi:hypothetical protein